MDSLKIILFSGVIFNLALVLFIVFQVKRARARNRDQALARRQQMVEQGKIITAQENLLKSKHELLKEKDELLKEYRKTNE
jgi:hypothetical protein